MSTLSTIGFGRNTKVFILAESTLNTLAIPTNTDLVIANAVELQVPMAAMEDDKGLRNTRSLINRYPTHTPPAPFKLTKYVRPSGAAGTAPEGSVMIESVMGKKTVTGGVSVAYTPLATQPSFCMYVKKDHTVYAASGGVVTKRGLKKDQKSMLEAAAEGAFASVIWTGTAALGIAISTTPAPGTEEEFAVSVAADTRKFCTGSHVIIDSEQMQITGTAWEGTAAAGKLKFKRGYNSSTPATHTISSVISPWLPAGTEAGAPLAARAGALTIDAVTVPVLDFTYEFDSGAKHIEDEVNGTGKSADYMEGDIKVSGKMSIFFRKADAQLFSYAQTQTRRAAVLTFGTLAGKIVTITMPSVEFDMPVYSGERDAMKLDLNYRAFAVAGLDEVEEKYT